MSTKHKMISGYYDLSVELDILGKEGWKAISHSVTYNSQKDTYFYTALLIKKPAKPAPFIYRGPG